MEPTSRLEQKIDQIIEDITELKVQGAENTTSLQEHIRRTNLLQDIVMPIQKKFAMLEGAMKFIGIIATAISVVAGIIKIIQFLQIYF